MKIAQPVIKAPSVIPAPDQVEGKLRSGNLLKKDPGLASRRMRDCARTTLSTPHTSSGFTLIELMIVIAILAILLGIGIASYNSYHKSQLVKQSQEDVAAQIKLAQTKAQTGDLAAQCKEEDGREFDGFYIHAHQDNTHVEHIAGSCSYSDGSGRIDIGSKQYMQFLTQNITFSKLEIFDSNDNPIDFNEVGDGVYILFPPLTDDFEVYTNTAMTDAYRLTDAAKVVFTISDGGTNTKTVTVLKKGVVSVSQ